MAKNKAINAKKQNRNSKKWVKLWKKFKKKKLVSTRTMPL